MAIIVDGDATDYGWRLDHFREGVSEARVVWRDRDGNEHERVTREELKAIALLDWLAGHPRMEPTFR